MSSSTDKRNPRRYNSASRRLTHLLVLETLLDSGGVGPAGLDVFSDDFPRRNALPLEVLRESFKVLLALGAWRTNEENAAHLVHLDLL